MLRDHRSLPCFAALVLSLAAAGCEAGDGPTGSWPEENAQIEAELLAAVNAQRAAGAVCDGESFGPAPALVTHPLLVEAARAHSHDMVTRAFFSHTNPDGEDPGDRLEALGYPWTAYGENIASGQTSVDEVMRAWMGSPGHCSNIMDPDFTEIGLGFHETRWTQVFGRR